MYFENKEPEDEASELELSKALPESAGWFLCLSREFASGREFVSGGLEGRHSHQEAGEHTLRHHLGDARNSTIRNVLHYRLPPNLPTHTCVRNEVS